MKTFKRLTAGLLTLILLMSSMSILSQAATNTAVKNFRVLFNDENGIVVGWDFENDKKPHDIFLEYSENKKNWKKVEPIRFDGVLDDSTVLAIRNDGDNKLKTNTAYYFRMVDKTERKTFRSSIISAVTKSKLNKFDNDYFASTKSTAIHVITADFMLTITDPTKKTAWIQYATPSAIKNGVLTLPAKINGYSIISIGGYVLEKIRDANKVGSIRKIVFADGIKEIFINYETNAPCFNEVPKLKEIVFPDNITIGDGMFAGCNKLEKVTFKGELKGGIGDYTFIGCTALKEIKIPEGVKYIAESAFENCTALKKIKIPEGVKYIAESAFENCKSLKKVTFPSTLKSIGENAFYGCKSIEGKLKLPKNLEKVGDGAFAFCYGLTGFRIADGNKYFSQKGGVLFNKDKTKIYCYLSGKETKEYKMPSTVKSISEYSFVGTKHLKKLTFSDKVKSVPYVVFWKSNIKYIVFSKSVKKVRDLPEADTLKSITVKNKNCEMPVGITGNYRGKNITVYGYKNSTAQKFAKKAKLKFVAIK